MAKIELKKYSLGEELVSSISHGFGALFAIFATVIGIIKSVDSGSLAVVTMSIFGFSMINLYLMSTLYHSLARNGGKKVFRVLDHCSIFLLIAGTYTPYALLVLKGFTGWLIFSIVWISAIVGIVLNAVNLKKFRKFSMACYLIMGWVILIAFSKLVESIAIEGLILLILGGILYSIGAIIYGLGRKVKYMHSIWHFFVLAGTLLHFASVYLYVL